MTIRKILYACFLSIILISPVVLTGCDDRTGGPGGPGAPGGASQVR